MNPTPENILYLIAGGFMLIVIGIRGGWTSVRSKASGEWTIRVEAEGVLIVVVGDIPAGIGTYSALAETWPESIVLYPVDTAQPKVWRISPDPGPCNRHERRAEAVTGRSF